MKGRMLDLQRQRATSGEKKFLEHIRTPTFSEAISVIETI